MLVDARGRGAEALGEVGGRGRGSERREDRRAAASEQGGKGLAVARLGGRPQRPDPAGRVDERGLPRLVGHGEDPWPREGRGHEQQAAAAQVDLLVGAAVDLQDAVAPAHVGMQVLEDLDRPARGQAPGAMHDVGLERGAQVRPPRRDRALEVAGHDARELAQARRRVLEERAQHGRRRSPVQQPAQLAQDGLGRRRADALELALEVGQRRRGWRREEVGDVAPAMSERVEQRVVEALQPGAGGPGPREVQRVRRGIAQDVGAPLEVEERRDREAGADEIGVAEVKPDHWRR